MLQINEKSNQGIKENIKLFHKGENFTSYKFMGAHFRDENKKRGVRFTTWAPRAKEVYVVGDFCDFTPDDKYRMKRINDEGIWSLFIPNIKDGEKYKYYIVSNDTNNGIYKADPYAFYSELRPNTASVIKKKDKFKWTDKRWFNKRRAFNPLNIPINIYEIHLGSWKKNGEEFLTYRELSKVLPKYLKEMEYTHVEFMPLSEYPLDASWGYQITGYYSINSRYGSASELKELINELHRNDIGVILDWVPGHFCRDEHGLFKFDGTPTYEYEEEWKSENKGWGTANFDLGRCEVRSFLISNAFYWIKEFHIDGLRVDAVSNMIYLNYGRKEDEWIPNKYGGDGCLEGVEFIKELNRNIDSKFTNILMIAEESTAWPKVTDSIEHGGLGFNFKWNMGWMNDTLKYVELDPIYRKYNHNKINFSIMYNHSESFILPISHDEVVHGKKSLIDKMWGDYWNKFAGLRLYLAYMIGHPGKKLTFMGSEFAQFIEWREYEELEWKLTDKFEMHKLTQIYVRELNKFYKNNRALWEMDYDTNGFEWIDANNNDQSIFIFIRRGIKDEDTLIFICNFTPIVHYDFKLGVPFYGEYREVFNSDSIEFGGSNQLNEEKIKSEKFSYHNKNYSIIIKVPPMAVSVLAISNINKGE
ncbi:1,4-alpha-glucan branching protein GlgB [Clostridium tertium]|uniref:1,4-alpha-glucan branching enzyme GlgB n=1 Tax=Clostridium tertium TaxID=1559 RepID=A0A6N3F826_9CLOT